MCPESNSYVYIICMNISLSNRPSNKIHTDKGASNSLSCQLSRSLVPEVQLNSLKITSLFFVPLNLFGDGSIYNIYIIINSSYLTPNIFTIKIKMLAIFYSNFVVLFFSILPFICHYSLTVLIVYSADYL